MSRFAKWLLGLFLTFFMALPAEGKRLKVGLVLGGGGAKGAAEVGVLKYIEKCGIPVDFVVGTSIGSIVGGLYCSGVSPEKMEQLFLRQDWISLFTDRRLEHREQPLYIDGGNYYVFGFPVYQTNMLDGRDGLLRGDSIVRLLGNMTGQRKFTHFDNLKIPFRCVAVDLETMSEVVLDKGILPECLRASMSIPVAFNTKMHDGRKLIDGGAINNLPVDVAKRMGADVIIAVDLDQAVRRTTHLKKTPKDDSIDWMGLLTETIDVGSIVNTLTGEVQIAKDNQINIGNLINWFTRHPDDKKYKQNLQMVDVLIRPNLWNFDIASFEKGKIIQMIKAGEKAGLEAVPQLLELKKKVYMSAIGF